MKHKKKPYLKRFEFWKSQVFHFSTLHDVQPFPLKFCAGNLPISWPKVITVRMPVVTSNRNLTLNLRKRLRELAGYFGEKKDA